MKHLITFLFLILIIGAVAQAQTPRPVSIYLGGGISPLSGDYGDVWKMGFHGLVGIGIKAAPGFQVVPKIEYHTFPLDKGSAPVSGGTLSSMMFGADFRYEFGLPEAQVKPVVLGGAGAARASISDLSGGGESLDFGSETKVYFEFGGGLVFGSAPTKFFITVRYTSVALEGVSLNYIPVTLGVKF